MGVGSAGRHHLFTPAFVQKAKTLNPKYIAMIIPARWYSDGIGCEFRGTMLNDPCLTTLVDFVRSREIFPQVDIKGGYATSFGIGIRCSGNQVSSLPAYIVARKQSVS